MALTVKSIVDHNDLEAAFSELTVLLNSRVTRTLVQREHHSHGESYHDAGLPDIVCFPTSTSEVSEIMRISSRHRIPVVPFGAGTSLEGHVNALYGGVCVDLRQMNKVLRVNAEDSDATVEAGVTRQQLVKTLNNTGLTFFVDPGADATIGGMASTRASGTTAVRYGTMRENILGLTVVLADGRVIHTGTRARKSSAGYDLTHLFVGAEGTLGVLTEITLRLHPLPEAVSVAVCCFETIQGAVETAMQSIQLGAGLARIEFLDDKQIEAINRYSKINLPIRPTLFFEFHGMSSGNVAEQAEFVQSLASEHGGDHFQWKSNMEDMEALWNARHNAYFASRALRPGSGALSTDVCVPISRLADCITATKVDLLSVSFPATIVGHVGDGNFHVFCMIDPKSASEMEEVARFSERLVERALKMSGTCTGEHGIGVGKKKYLSAELGASLDVMRTLKRALDPENRLNPGKVFDFE